MAKKASAKRPARGRLKSLRVSSGVREFVLDQLAGLRGVRDRAMFGGVGLYADDVFFGILASDVLYFKVDDSNRRDYELAGAGPFKPYADRAMTMPYYAVPLVVVEDATTLVKWAKRAVDVAMASKRSARTPSKKMVTPPAWSWRSRRGDRRDPRLSAAVAPALPEPMRDGRADAAAGKDPEVPAERAR